MMLDKNPELVIDRDISEIKNKFSRITLNVVLCSNPFAKAYFLNKLIDSIDCKIIYLDFDLLYSGYVTAKLIKKNSKVTIYHLNKERWNEGLAHIIEQISKEKFLIIIDSLNSVNNLFEGKDSARFVNSSIMLLAACGRNAKSYLIAIAMARKKDGEWVLLPGGRHVLDPKIGKIYRLKEIEGDLSLFEFTKKPNH